MIASRRSCRIFHFKKKDRHDRLFAIARIGRLDRDHCRGRIVVSGEIGSFVSRVGSLDGAGDPDAKNSH
jgi:hypothetical protein